MTTDSWQWLMAVTMTIDNYNDLQNDWWLTQKANCFGNIKKGWLPGGGLYCHS